MKKLLAFSGLAVLWSLILPAPVYAAGEFIGISLATQNEERFYREGYYLYDKLRKAGFRVEMFYAGDGDVLTQQMQLRRLIDEGCKVLVVGAVDPQALENELKLAREKEIKIIAYDMLLMNTDYVDYMVTFNDTMCGYLQGEYLERKLKLRQASPKNPVHIELFAGSINDINSRFLWNGAMNVLLPYINSHALMVSSGEIAFEFSATDSWDSYAALQRMEGLIKDYDYKPGGMRKLDAVLSPSDNISEGIMLALDNAGFKGGDGYPLVTGQYCHAVNVHSMLENKQRMCIFKDGRLLADAALQMIDEITTGRQVTINNDFNYDNGKKIVPAVECNGVVVDITNYERILVNSGVMTKEQIAFPYR